MSEKEDFAFSNDSEAPQQKVANLLRQHKQKQLKLSRETQVALEVPDLKSDSDNEEITDAYVPKTKLKSKKEKIKNQKSLASDKSSVKFDFSSSVESPTYTVKNTEFKVLRSKQ